MKVEIKDGAVQVSFKDEIPRHSMAEDYAVMRGIVVGGDESSISFPEPDTYLVRPGNGKVVELKAEIERHYHEALSSRPLDPRETNLNPDLL